MPAALPLQLPFAVQYVHVTVRYVIVRYVIVFFRNFVVSAVAIFLKYTCDNLLCSVFSKAAIADCMATASSSDALMFII